MAFDLIVSQGRIADRTPMPASRRGRRPSAPAAGCCARPSAMRGANRCRKRWSRRWRMPTGRARLWRSPRRMLRFALPLAASLAVGFGLAGYLLGQVGTGASDSMGRAAIAAALAARSRREPPGDNLRRGGPASNARHLPHRRGAAASTCRAQGSPFPASVATGARVGASTSPWHGQAATGSMRRHPRPRFRASTPISTQSRPSHCLPRKRRTR